MKRQLKLFAFLLLGILLLSTKSLYAQNHDHDHGSFDLVLWFGILELPFLLVCVYYSFKTAGALKGGVFGIGMNYLAWGFLVMAVGHLAMQINHIWGFDVFRDTLGNLLGNIVWFIALMITWGLSAYGFYRIYDVSQKG